MEGDNDQSHDYDRPVSLGIGHRRKTINSNSFTIPKRNRSRPRSGKSRNVAEEEEEDVDGGHNEAGYRGRNSAPPGRSLEERLANLGIDLEGLKDLTSEGTPKKVRGGRKTININLNDSGDSGSDLSDRKSARLSSDISRRISGISNSMEEYDKKVKDVTESINEVYRKSVDSMRSRKAIESEDVRRGKSSPGGSSGDSLEAYLRKSRDNLAKDLLTELGHDYQVTSPAAIPGPGGDNNNSAVIRNKVGNLSPRKIFGLDAAAILESSSSEDSSDEDDDDKDSDSSTSTDTNDSGPGAMRISIRHAGNTKHNAMKRLEQSLKQRKDKDREPRVNIRRRSKIPPELQPEPRSLSPIMPALPDKQFKSMLERREERVNRNLNSMKNELAQLNQKVEMDRKKAGSVGGSSSNTSRKIANTTYQGRPMKLMKGQPDKHLHSEFNEFVQATGGKAGGWERSDHQSFMKTFEIWRHHPNKLMDALKKELPHKKSSEIASHIKWFERFEELSSKNKESVQKWSIEKRRENEVVFQMGSASHRAKLEGEKRRQEHLRMIREQERDKSKQKLAQWKRARSRTASAAGQNFSPDPREEGEDSEGHRPNTQIQATMRKKKTQDSQILGEYRDDTGSLDISSVRQHILEITAKVHSLDHPKREFLPPRPSTISRKKDSVPVHEEYPPSRSFSRSRKGTEVDDHDHGSRRGSVRLPEIDPGPDSISRPTSQPGSRSVGQRNKLNEFRERDSRLVQAKKQAVEIARERRKANLNQLTAEELKRRIRSRTGPSQILNPTKQSEIRKSLTHLERLEMLSKQDLNMVNKTPALPPSPESMSGRYPMDSSITSGLPPIINHVPTKGVPSWRRSQQDGSFGS